MYKFKLKSPTRSKVHQFIGKKIEQETLWVLKFSCNHDEEIEESLKMQFLLKKNSLGTKVC